MKSSLQENTCPEVGDATSGRQNSVESVDYHLCRTCFKPLEVDTPDSVEFQFMNWDCQWSDKRISRRCIKCESDRKDLIILADKAKQESSSRLLSAIEKNKIKAYWYSQSMEYIEDDIPLNSNLSNWNYLRGVLNTNNLPFSQGSYYDDIVPGVPLRILTPSLTAKLRSWAKLYNMRSVEFVRSLLIIWKLLCQKGFLQRDKDDTSKILKSRYLQSMACYGIMGDNHSPTITTKLIRDVIVKPIYFMIIFDDSYLKLTGVKRFLYGLTTKEKLFAELVHLKDRSGRNIQAQGFSSSDWGEITEEFVNGVKDMMIKGARVMDDIYNYIKKAWAAFKNKMCELCGGVVDFFADSLILRMVVVSIAIYIIVYTSLVLSSTIISKLIAMMLGDQPDYVQDAALKSCLKVKDLGDKPSHIIEAHMGGVDILSTLGIALMSYLSDSKTSLAYAWTSACRAGKTTSDFMEGAFEMIKDFVDYYYNKLCGDHLFQTCADKAEWRAKRQLYDYYFFNNDFNTLKYSSNFILNFKKVYQRFFDESMHRATFKDEKREYYNQATQSKRAS
jgi:hypothetical protein